MKAQLHESNPSATVADAAQSPSLLSSGAASTVG
eukprot:CAMPEP_0183313556 /NCGR_PEP_ID=MMETSP0160_2-20130417/45690_1 /TAXON_ID=2839 ORGANISM="Odontella Sinensis, Strain Grunow 1884" /NCGR_SAMPLE_ID=MMETSP0160_2 /ASSEMBLY_ACC=CAM_ASM_000250 /LENGTH=33 /DNA_ID= /DNA_START= /DNA_END= /DNA_ORIENTATION=